MLGALLCIAAPLPALLVYGRFPVVGFWDAGCELLLLGAGTLLSAHRAFERWRDVALAATATLIGLILLELNCRMFLPPAPMFAVAGGAHLLLASALQATPELQPADTRSKEIVCSVVYGDAYPGLLGLPPDPSLVLPHTYQARAGAPHRALHLGDSMVYGLGVERDETFTAILDRLNPDVQHINGGISGIAPDAYFAVLRSWLAMYELHQVVLYLFAGNDVRDIDGPYPCCNWQSLLSYDHGASLRCSQPTPPDLTRTTWTWLRHNSPPPYLVRALIGRSVVAAYLGAIMVEAGMRNSSIADQSDEMRLFHIEAVLRAAAKELQTRSTSLLVVALPDSNEINDSRRAHSTTKGLMEAARRAGVPAVDASDMIAQAAQDGQRVFLGSPERPDVHFNRNGHELMANWLAKQLSIGAKVPHE